MRSLVMAAMAAGMMMAGGCSSEPADTAERNAAIANFTPPSVTSRADFGGVIERRFQRLDKNNDLRLDPTELPERRADAIMEKYDADNSGSIDSAEWGKFMLDRFDAIDTNKDASVTSGEREAEREQRRAAEGVGTSETLDTALDEASNVAN